MQESTVFRHIVEVLELISAVIYSLFLSICQTQPRRVVLYYHGVRDEDAQGFERQMVYLAGSCIVVKASQIIEAATDGERPVVAITFDDAFISVLENAIPVLKSHGLTATVFVPTGQLAQLPRWEMRDGQPDRFDAVMSERQIAEVAKDGFEVLSHAVSHTNLTEIDGARLEKEMKDSKHTLEKILGCEVCGISYPYGACNSRVCNAAKAAGYRLGFTIEPATVSTSTDLMQIGRFAVSPHDGLLKSKLKVTGAYQVVNSLRRIKRTLLRH